ncbi:MAG: hypothetical protein JW967_02420 [Dehalococcoidales bacterium]|nr:hypothetical protein [Dehalococcoidales bacterium]
MKTKSSADMLTWQYRALIEELSHVTLHAGDDSCPCNQVELDPPEYCLGKHLLMVSSLARETALMDEAHRKILADLNTEALEYHNKAKTIYCKGGTWPDLEKWSRNWRKQIEPVYYSCNAKAHLKEDVIANLFEKYPMVKVKGNCKSNTCSFTVTHTEKTEAISPSIKSLPDTIDELLKQVDAKKRTVSNKTTAFGQTGVTKYDFEYRIIEGDKLNVSHDPHTFTPNPKYPAELQPRIRERAAQRLQVQNISQNLEPDALLVDFQSIDRGAPIIDAHYNVLSGNGRTMALLLAAGNFPDKYAAYRKALLKIAPAYGIETKQVEKLKMPVLVRELLTKVSLKDFAQEANAPAAIESSAIEKARTDADKITSEMLNGLNVLEGEGIEDAIRSARNKSFVTAFLNKLPANEQARLVDAQGQLSQDGVRRAAMALFVATFKGDTGLRLAEKYFESTDVNVKNIFNGITGSLGMLAKAESMALSGQRDPDYIIGDDMAKAVSVYSGIKKTPGMTVEKYLNQSSMLERELNPFQEKILKALDEHSRSGKRIAGILSGYAQKVIDSPPPAQGSFMPESRATKEHLFDSAVRSLMVLAELFDLNRENTSRLIAAVKYLMEDEQGAVRRYKELAKEAAQGGYKEVGRVFNHIAADENEHYKSLFSIQDIVKLNEKPVPKLIEIYPNSIVKHYIDSKECRPGTFRVLKPDPHLMVFICCRKGQHWVGGHCHGKPTVHKTIIRLDKENRTIYEQEVEQFRKMGVPVENGAAEKEVLPQMNETVPAKVKKAISNSVQVRLEEETGYLVCKAGGQLRKQADITGEAHSISIPLTCDNGKIHALVHEHPTNPSPSPQDLKTAAQLKIPVCIIHKREVTCYRVVATKKEGSVA